MITDKLIKLLNEDTISKKLDYTLTDGTKVYIVDGAEIRNIFDVKFYGGGHGYVYDFIPKDEIWVEDMKDPADTKFFKDHEVEEYKDMKYEHKSYDEAHEKASKYEAEMRKKEGYSKDNTYKKEDTL
jgi:hypothetical protein